MPRQQLRHQGLPPKLLGPMLVDSRGVLRFWPTAWSILFAASIRPSTLAAKLAAIERLYRHADDLFGPHGLDQAITDLDFDSLETVLEGFFVRLTNTGRPTTVSKRKVWQHALAFVRDCTDLLVKSYTGPQQLYMLQSRLQRLERLYVQLAPSNRQSVEILRALPAGVVEDLYEVIQAGDTGDTILPALRLREGLGAEELPLQLLQQDLPEGILRDLGDDLRQPSAELPQDSLHHPALGAVRQRKGSLAAQPGDQGGPQDRQGDPDEAPGSSGGRARPDAPDASTNQAESFFSRIRKVAMGIHHRMSGKYLDWYVADLASREDMRRHPLDWLFQVVLAKALAHPVSRNRKGYWQGNKPPETLGWKPALVT